MSSEELTHEDELAGWKDLLASRGWALLMAYAKQQHGPEGYGRAMQAKLASIPQGPDRAHLLAHAAEMVDATASAVNGLMAWPASRVQLLGAKAASTRPFDYLRRA